MPAIIPVAASVGGALISANASKSAAKTQANAANAASAQEMAMFNANRADQAPWREAGHSALNQLAFRLGLTTTGFGGPPAPEQKTEQQFRNELLSQYTSGGNSAAIGGSNNGPLIASYGPDGSLTHTPAQTQAAQTQGIDEAGLSAAVQRAMQAQAAEQAKRQAQSQAAMTDPNYGSLLRNFTAADMNADPVYQSGLQFGLTEGQKGIDRAFAAKGGALSGAAAKAMARFGNDYASTKANESYNRFNNNQSQTYNRLAGISGTGQTSANQIATQGMQTANSIGNNTIGAGNARASGYIGGANAVSGAVGQGINMWQQNQMMDLLRNNQQNTNRFGWAGMGGFGDSYGTSPGE